MRNQKFEPRSNLKLNVITCQGVYSKNQNFRLLLSSKYGKSNYLQSCNAVDIAEVFFDSLITGKSLIINTRMPIQSEGYDLIPRSVKNSSSFPEQIVPVTLNISRYPAFDELVKTQIGNGLIYKVVLYENKSTGKPMIKYCVKNYNYCANVGRFHKSNTIYFMGNISNMCVYQKCHKCVGFKGREVYLTTIRQKP